MFDTIDDTDIGTTCRHERDDDASVKIFGKISNKTRMNERLQS